MAEKPTDEEMMYWAADNPTRGQAWAGYSRIMDEFGCTQYRAKQIAKSARYQVELNEATVPLEKIARWVYGDLAAGRAAELDRVMERFRPYCGPNRARLAIERGKDIQKAAPPAPPGGYMGPLLDDEDPRVSKGRGAKPRRTKKGYDHKAFLQGVADKARNPDPDPVGILKTNRELRQQLQQYRAMEKVYRDIFAEIQPALPAYKRAERELPRFRKSKKQPSALMADLSDWQVGLRVRPEDTMHLGGYGFDVFKERLRRLRDVILTVYEEQIRVRPITELVINFIGDLLEGLDIYRGQAWHTDLELQEQFQELMRYAGFFIRDLALRIPKLTIYAVWGNHGRHGRKGENPGKTNAEYMLLLQLQLYISQLKGVRMSVANCPLLAYEFMGRSHLLAHGDKTRQWMQVPFYGLTRDTMRYITMTGRVFNYVHFGHHHRNADWRESGTEILLNGSLCGPTSYSVDDIKAAEPASQTLYLVHPEHGLNWRCPVQFERRRVLVADGDGILTPVSKMEDVPSLAGKKDW